MTDPEPTSDFGYDLVHEEPRPDRRDASVAAHSGPPAVPRRDGDGGGDLGYDDAHDF